MTTVIDFNTRKQESSMPTNEPSLSKKEILVNILTMLSEDVDDIDELVVAFSTKDDSFRANSNTNDTGTILLLLEQARLGVMGVYEFDE